MVTGRRWGFAVWATLASPLLVVGAIMILAADAWAGPMGLVRPDTSVIRVSVEAGRSARGMRRTGNLIDRRRLKRDWLLGAATYSFSNRNAVTLRAGLGEMRIQDRFDPAGGIGPEYNGTREIAWGGGFGALLFDGKRLSLAAQVNALVILDAGGPWPGVAVQGNRFDFHEWGAGLQLQTRIRRWRIEPYIGLRYSDARVTYKTIGGARDGRKDEAERNLGGYLGGVWTIDERWSAWGEVSTGDCNSGFVGVRYGF